MTTDDVLSKHTKLIMALADEEVLVGFKDAEETIPLCATLHLYPEDEHNARFELACGVRITNVAFKRIELATGPGNIVTVTLDLY